ncbi:MAG: DUF362 domain-containing protein [Oscillospiraceae bacterium]|nr:DUF362 domain-containing protein [Oscillospiraceae bacterium]
MTAKVYFTKEISPEKVVEMYGKLGISLPGKVAVKVHTGEKGNQNFLRPEFWKLMTEAVGGTIVECNTAYGKAFNGGVRDYTDEHWQLIEYHGWKKTYPDRVDIMDAEGPDLVWPVENGRVLKENRVGRHILNYDSMLVLAHFKGHPMGGYGGALKQLSIGCASREGKALIHSGGASSDNVEAWKVHAEQDRFCEAMADAASTVVKHFGAGKIAFINVMKNLSVDCDCAVPAEDPCMADIGILASLDPVAIDRACMDLIYSSKDPGRDHFIERVESRHGTHTIDAAADLGFGTKEYELIEV